MTLATGMSLGLRTPLEFGIRLLANKNANDKDLAANSRFANNGTKQVLFESTNYSANRGIMCEKGFEDVPERVLLFQFNPDTINDIKGNNYNTKSFTGFTGNDFVWISGGERTITFELNFEATAGANTPMFNKGRNTSSQYGMNTVESLDEYFPNGTMDDVEILQAFLYPKKEDESAPRFSNGGYIPAPKFTPPPVVVFVYGRYYLEGVVTDVDIRHTLFDKNLIPRRTSANVTFKVIEAQTVVVKNVLNSKAKFEGPSQPRFV